MAPERCSTRSRLWTQVVLSTLLPAIFLIGFEAKPAGAQLFGSGRVAVATNFGVAVPTGVIGDMVLPGPTFGLQLMYQLSPRLGLGLEGGYDTHDGDLSPATLFTGPPFQVLHYGVSAEVALLPQRPGAFTIIAGGGAGLATMLSEQLYNPDAPPIGVTLDPLDPNQTVHSADPLHFEGTYPAFNARLQLAYVADSEITLFVEGRAFTSLLDEEKTTVFVIGPYPVAQWKTVGEEFEFVRPVDSYEPPGALSTFGIRVGLRKAL